uniref:cytochrome c oxidase subunit II n=1 Tax=Krisna quadrimaculosus TaxID=3041591 RepID=UPI002551D061|nr:cytochrome c oxidase subunit II [Krisna quadrimaculosus]WGG89448.1 cytochrome c oxidase subunit 2 [Krisna quadrimaculosus]
MMNWNMFIFQDSLSPIMEQLIMFHDHSMMIISMITISVMFMMSSLLINNISNRFMLEGQMIELIWTIIPAILLIFIAFPSIRILYLLEEMNNPMMTVKAVGHQWFWSYEYYDYKEIEFDSYMKMLNNNNEFRLIENDNRMILPYNIKIRMIISSSDVIHSWTIPCLGIKIDAIPGRINQGTMMITRPGLYFGQCSEICGSNHSFMPITLESVNINSLMNWLKI